jgi:hypothetical protein
MRRSVIRIDYPGLFVETHAGAEVAARAQKSSATHLSSAPDCASVTQFADEGKGAVRSHANFESWSPSDDV